MTMDHDGMRAYALTLAHRAVKDIRRDGFRQLRGLSLIHIWQIGFPFVTFATSKRGKIGSALKN